MSRAIGVLESISIARGIEAADAMVKAAPIRLYLAKTICPGKFLAMVGGDVAAVESSISRGVEVLGEYEADAVVIPNVHESVLLALEGLTELKEFAASWALGVIETFTVVACVHAADAAVKAGGVHLLEVRPAVGLGGKSFASMIGDVSAVESAVEAGLRRVSGEGMVLSTSVIPHISREVLGSLL